jgi:FkbM family methyltransferase
MTITPGAVRRTASSAKHAVLSRRVVTVRHGPAAGLRFSLRMASADYGDGLNEMPVQKAFCEHVTWGQTVFDIGSNVGFFACLAARLVGSDGEVHAFEAVPACARALERNVARNGFGQVEVHEMAVSDRAGSVEVLQGRHPGGATISVRDRPTDLQGTVTARCATIDDMIEAGDIPRPDFVKIDVEGAEPEVLSGMRETLGRDGPVILCELDARTSDGLAVKVAEVRALLDEAGYGVEELERSYVDSRSEVVHLLAVRTT